MCPPLLGFLGGRRTRDRAQRPGGPEKCLWDDKLPDAQGNAWDTEGTGMHVYICILCGPVSSDLGPLPKGTLPKKKKDLEMFISLQTQTEEPTDTVMRRRQSQGTRAP